MAAIILDGKATAARIREELQQKIAAFPPKKSPGLAVVLVGNNPASEVYVRNKAKVAEKTGIRATTLRFPETISETELLTVIEKLNRDDNWNGVLVQLPLPGHISEQRVIEAIDPKKDVDCFHPVNVGKLVIGMPIFTPCTPAGIVELLMRYNIDPEGKHVVILGRSNIVGKPLANILVQKLKGANAVVTIVHSRAKNIAALTRQADILVAAIGVPQFVKKEMVKPGAVVVDVGINRIEVKNSPKGYTLVGDVDYNAVASLASYITPVPGGVGPMTIVMLMANTVKAFEIQNL
jgi:methylenetetrahydrofolate dehydrogenase (NADP+)/methenyltetrahydrofolate cyclohydrolase